MTLLKEYVLGQVHRGHLWNKKADQIGVVRRLKVPEINEHAACITRVISMDERRAISGNEWLSVVSIYHAWGKPCCVCVCEFKIVMQLSAEKSGVADCFLDSRLVLPRFSISHKLVTIHTHTYPVHVLHFIISAMCQWKSCRNRSNRFRD